MTLSVDAGHILVMDGKEYPIKSVADWQTTRMNTSSFRRMAIKTASLKKESFDAENKSTEGIYASDLKATPLDPVDPDLRQTLGLDSAHELLQTFITDGDGYVHLIIEEIKD